LVLASQPLAAGQREITFTLDPKEADAKCGTVKLRLVDAATGAPIPGAIVALGVFHTASDAEGRVESPVLAGIHTMQVDERDHEWVWTRVKVQPGELLDLGDFPLSGVIAAKGRVLGVDPIRHGMTIVSWTDLSRQRFPQAIGHNVREYCDANGNFQIKRLGRSRYLLTARDESGNLAQRLLDTTSGGSAPFLELQLQPATAVVLVNSEPTGSFTVVAVDERQQTRNAVAVAPG
jgi:hypothetical protein